MSEKTEPPSPKRIRDARMKGQFLVSREIVSLASMLMIFSLLLAAHGTLLALVIHAITEAADAVAMPFADALPRVAASALIAGAACCATAYAGAVLAGIIGNIAQTGPVFNPAKLKKGLQAIDAFKNAKQMFSKRNLFTFGMNLVKIFIIAGAVTLVTRHMIATFMASLDCGFPCALAAGGHGLALMFALTIAAFVPVAVLDYIAQRHFYLKELRMSKEEVKREFKETEGDPEIKAQRKQAHQDVLDSSMMNRVAQSTVVVKNPIHCAVALLYEENDTPLPMVTGKGEGAMAAAILRTAERHNIPVYENVDLARALYRDVELGGFITGEFIEPVAEALQYVEDLTGART